MVKVGVESENGWQPARVAAEACDWVTVPGTSVTLQIQRGWPLNLLRAFAADFHAYVEPLRDDDSACWTPTNAVATSNHLNGTAMDLNWNSHPFRVSYAGYTPAMIATTRELLAFYEKTVHWGQDWGGNPYDAMHFQCGYDTWNNPRLPDFVARKIRSDGYSTFRRGGTPGMPQLPVPAPSRADRYALAIIAEGRRLGITRRGIIIGLSVALVETNLTMYANSNDPPSLLLPHDKVGSDHMSSGLFQQQTAWGTLADRMDPTASARIFFTVDHGSGVRGLTKIPYDYNSPDHTMGFYAQKVQGSAFPTRYDQRMAEATALYDRLAAGTVPAMAPAIPSPQFEDGFMSALTPDEQRALYNAVMAPQQSRSPLRHVGEGTVGNAPDQVWDTDGSVHVLLVYLCAVILGDPDAVALLREVAALNPSRYPDRVRDRNLAQAMLNVIAKVAPPGSAPATGQTPGTAPPSPPAPPPGVTWTAPALPATTEGGLFGEITALQAKLHAVSDMVTDITEGH